MRELNQSDAERLLRKKAVPIISRVLCGIGIHAWRSVTPRHRTCRVCDKHETHDPFFDMWYGP